MRVEIALLVSVCLHLVAVLALGVFTDSGYVLPSDLTAARHPGAVLQVRLPRPAAIIDHIVASDEEVMPTPPSVDLTPPSTEIAPVLNEEPDYYLAEQLTKRATPILALDADDTGPEADIVVGNLIVKLWVSRTGTVDKIELQRSSLPLEFTQSIVDKVKSSPFQPAEIQGRAVASIIRLQIAFDDLRDTRASEQ
jgi:hypothetical protein